MKIGRSQKIYVLGNILSMTVVFGPDDENGNRTYIKTMTYRQAKQQMKKNNRKIPGTVYQLIAVE